MEIKTYYSDGFIKNLLELSDNRLWWDISYHNKADNDISEEHVDGLCNIYANIFNEHYHTTAWFCGRSGRHICVDDTPTNRRNYAHMVNAVEIMQKLIVWRVIGYDMVYFNTYVKNVPAWVKKAEKEVGLFNTKSSKLTR